MGQDEWFDEDADDLDVPFEEKGKKSKKHHKPEDDDWGEEDDWEDLSD